MVLNLNSAEMTKLLKDVYLPAIQTETWNNSGALSEAFGLKGLGAKVNATSGKLDVYFQKGKHASVGAFGDDYTFDRATLKSTGDEAVIRTKGFQANARIDIVPNARLNGAEAIENIFDGQFEDLKSAMQKNYGRMLYGNGSGVIANVTAVGSATDGVKVDDIRAFEIGDIVTFKLVAATADAKKDINDATVEGNKAGIERVEADQEEKSKNRWATHGDGALELTANYITGKVEDIDDETGALFFDKLVDGTGTGKAMTDVANNSVVYYRNSIDEDIHGLDYIVNKDSGYFGLGEKVYGKATAGDTGRPKYLNSKLGTSANFLTEDVFMKFMDDIELRGKETPDFLVTSRGTRRSIASSNQGATTGIVRLMRDAGATAANDQRSMGYQGVDLKGESIEVDRFAPKGKLWFLNLGSFEMANEQDLTFDDYNGVMWKQVLKGNKKGNLGGPQRVLSYEANMYAYKELFNKNPRANGMIEITTPKVVKPEIDATKAGDVKELGQ